MARSKSAKSSKHPDFLLPSVTSIDGRISGITAAFFKAITPVVVPTEEDVDEVLRILGMSRGQSACAYCGGKHSEWDHFRPIVKDKQPTGYITEIANLVPSCGQCNQSKRAAHWKEWMLSSAPASPTMRSIPDIPGKIARLEVFERWRVPTKIDYDSAIPPERWAAYVKKMDEIVGLLKAAQVDARELQELIKKAFEKI